MTRLRNIDRYKDVNATQALSEAAAAARHAVSELDIIDCGGTPDDERLTGIRSELLDAALLLSASMDDSEDAPEETVGAVRETADLGPGYPI